MNREKLLQSLRRLARKKGVPFEVYQSLGKGSHYRVRFGDRKTIIQKRIDPNVLRSILKQLDVDPADL